MSQVENNIISDLVNTLFYNCLRRIVEEFNREYKDNPIGTINILPVSSGTELENNSGHTQVDRIIVPVYKIINTKTSVEVGKIYLNNTGNVCFCIEDNYDKFLTDIIYKAFFFSKYKYVI